MLISASIAGGILEYMRGRASFWFFHCKPHWSRRLLPLSTCVSCDFLQVLSKQSGVQRAAYHHLRALYSPWQHLRLNIWVEISQISPEDKLAHTAAQTSAPERWNGAETETQMPMSSWNVVGSLVGWMLVRVFISRLNGCACYSGASLVISRVHSERKRRKRNRAVGGKAWFTGIYIRISGLLPTATHHQRCRLWGLSDFTLC